MQTDDVIDNELKIYNINEAEKLEYIKNNTNGLNGINIEEVKQIETDYWNNVYVLLKNGDFYINGTKQGYNTDKLHFLDGFHLYRVQNENKILPMGNIEEWDKLDLYLYNEGNEYKKIVTDLLYIVGLTENNRVIAVSFNPAGLGVIPENFVDVQDIKMVQVTEQCAEPYIVKNNKELPLYISNT